MVSISTETTQIEQYRQHFPYLETAAYFNYGGQGPMARSAIDAIHKAQELLQKMGPFSSAVNAWMGEEAKQTRMAIAIELNCPVETITLTEDVSVGCNIALWGIDWNAGDHLLLTDCEHPGIVAAAQEIQRRFKIEVSMCPLKATLNEGDPVAVIAEHLRPQTRLVVLSHILWNTGQVLPLAAIVSACQTYPSHHPVRILVDAAQSVGVLPLNLTDLGADFYAFTGHKWWCGPAGVGGLYVRPEARESLAPTFIGWRSITTNSSGTPIGWQPDGRRYEIATSAVPLYTGLRDAIALQSTYGTIAERYQQVCERSTDLWQRLRDLPTVKCLRSTPPEAGLVSFQLESGNHNSLVQTLESKGIFVRTILDPDCVRACVHYFTTEAEINRLVEAIKEF
ncbi:MAG: aminotransferase class V-fold PLP-dependent enzyme [Candidatus Parcubacteria bacterium]|nr:aminotransferase class V-fold PLP-dependent enzyme [Leptolyngbyaceae cyanobacterium LF-bin-113]